MVHLGWLAVLLAGAGAVGAPAQAGDVWVITAPTEVTAPREVGDVVVATGGTLTVRGVGAPGLRLRGNLAIMGTGAVLIEDTARLLLDRSLATSTLALGGQGVVAAWGLDDTPTRPPRPGEAFELVGTVLQLSQDAAAAAGRWRLEAQPCGAAAPIVLAEGEGNVEHARFGTWPGLDARRSWTLRMVLTDGLGRTLEGAQGIPSELRARRRLPGAGREDAPAGARVRR